MKNKGVLAFVIVLAAMVVGAYLPTNLNSAEKESILIRTMVEGLNQLHFQPVGIDDEFSAKAFDMYIDRLDPGKRWLTQGDVKALHTYK
ncbi:MAG: tail-specific protease, partial [Saprospiraceae bacterium]|nr:tail-specific protease [Saprospiraceae bacterium]